LASTAAARIDPIDAWRKLVHDASMFEAGGHQLIAKTGIRGAPVTIERKRDDCQCFVRLADLLVQEIPIQFLLLINDRDVDALNPRKLFIVWRTDLHATNVLSAEQAIISRHTINVRHPPVETRQ
jgi:hypothetical protein